MTKVTIRAKQLQHVRQIAKDAREQNVTVYITKDTVCFIIGKTKAVVTLVGRENGNGK